MTEKITIKNDNFYIKQDQKTPNVFTIQFSNPSKSLIQSLIKTKCITSSLVTPDYKTMKFKTSSIQTFQQFQQEQQAKTGTTRLSTSLAAKLFSDLTKQLSYLISIFNQCFLGYHPENIIVIDQDKFAYLSSEHLSPVNHHNHMIHTFPFSPNDFYLSPEQEQIRELPAYVPYTSAFYSLASFSLSTIETEETEDQERETLIEERLNNLAINGTPFYWILKKCLTTDPLERRIIYI